MDNRQLYKKLIPLLKGYQPSQRDNEIMQKISSVKKIIDIYESWDGNPKNLDTSSFTLKEVLLTIDEIVELEEHEQNQTIQDNAVSHVKALDSMQYICLTDLPRVKKGVDYI